MNSSNAQNSSSSLLADSEKGTAEPVENINAFPGFEAGNETLKPSAPPHVVGEQSVSGDMPDPSSDDDTLRMSHEVGLRLEEEEENPQPLNIAADVATAEKSRS